MLANLFLSQYICLSTPSDREIFGSKTVGKANAASDSLIALLINKTSLMTRASGGAAVLSHGCKKTYESVAFTCIIPLLLEGDLPRLYNPLVFFLTETFFSQSNGKKKKKKKRESVVFASMKLSVSRCASGLVHKALVNSSRKTLSFAR